MNPIIVSYKQDGSWDADFEKMEISRIRGGVRSRRGRLFRKIQLTYYAWKLTSFCKKHNIEAIFSFSNPQESNVLGALLSKKLNIPFISHFSDPYLNNPYKKYEREIEEYVSQEEKFIIENSKKVIVTNEVAKILISSSYMNELDKFEVIYHCYEPKYYPQKTAISETFTISHIGAFYVQRSPEILLKAINFIEKHFQDEVKNIRLQFVGGLNDYAGFTSTEMDKLIKLYPTKASIEILPPVNYAESLRLMKESDCLVVIDADIINSPFLPSKLIDYIGARVPILAFTPKNSPTAQALEKFNVPSFSNEEYQKSADYLLKLITGEVHIDWNSSEIFNAKNTQAKLASLIKGQLG